MPLYEYRCSSCGHRFEVLQRLGADGSELSCPHCAIARPQRQFSTFAAHAASPSSACAPQGCGAPACASGFT